MKELDVVLTRYLVTRWPLAGEAERALFEQLLEQPDPQIAAWLMGRELPFDPPLQALVGKLREG
jgi:succinate dehydrogenase flavin-adding protein (antitoxin of CptAB toxin-antitoxin module)